MNEPKTTTTPNSWRVMSTHVSTTAVPGRETSPSGRRGWIVLAIQIAIGGVVLGFSVSWLHWCDVVITHDGAQFVVIADTSHGLQGERPEIHNADTATG